MPNSPSPSNAVAFDGLFYLKKASGLEACEDIDRINQFRRARLGPSQATVATAHVIARVVYCMLKYKVEYEPLSVNEYQRQYDVQQIKHIKKRAAKFGFQLVPA